MAFLRANVEILYKIGFFFKNLCRNIKPLFLTFVILFVTKKPITFTLNEWKCWNEETCDWYTQTTVNYFEFGLHFKVCGTRRQRITFLYFLFSLWGWKMYKFTRIGAPHPHECTYGNKSVCCFLMKYTSNSRNKKKKKKEKEIGRRKKKKCT